MSDSFSVQRPSAGTQTGRVWEVADRLSDKLGRKAKRQEVIDAYAREGGNPNTASTQFSQWNKTPFHSERTPLHKSVALDVPPVRLEIGRDGRVHLPADIRAALRLGQKFVVTAEVQDGVLTLMSPRTATMRLQKLVQAQDKGTGSVVDELLAERKAEANEA